MAKQRFGVFFLHMMCLQIWVSNHCALSRDSGLVLALCWKHLSGTWLYKQMVFPVDIFTCSCTFLTCHVCSTSWEKFISDLDSLPRAPCVFWTISSQWPCVFPCPLQKATMPWERKQQGFSTECCSRCQIPCCPVGQTTHILTVCVPRH